MSSIPLVKYSAMAIVIILLQCSCMQSTEPNIYQGKFAIDHPELLELSEPVNRTLFLARKEWERQLASEMNHDEWADDYAQLAQVYLAHGFNTAASGAFDAAISLDPDQADWHYLQGITFYRLRHLARATQHFSTAYELARDPIALLKRTQCSIEMGLYSQAREDLYILEKNNQESAVSHVLRARVALAVKNYPAARIHIEMALSSQPEATSLYRSLVMILRELGEDKLAQQTINKIGNQKLHWADTRVAHLITFKRTVRSHLDEGQEYIEERNYPMAAQQFNKAVELGPNNASARVALGRSLEILGDASAALDEYLMALHLDPENSIAHYFIGTYYERQQLNSEALEHYNRAVEIDSEHIPSRLMLAHSLYRGGSYEAARNNYHEIIHRKKRHVLANYYLGLSHLALGDCDAALAVFEQAYKIKANSNSIKEALARTIAVCSDDKDQLSIALDLSEQLMSTIPDAESAQTLAMVYASSNDYDKAIQYQKLAIQRLSQQQSDHDTLYLEDQLARYRSGERSLAKWPLTSARFSPPPLTPNFKQ